MNLNPLRRILEVKPSGIWNRIVSSKVHAVIQKQVADPILNPIYRQIVRHTNNQLINQTIDQMKRP